MRYTSKQQLVERFLSELPKSDKAGQLKLNLTNAISLAEHYIEEVGLEVDSVPFKFDDNAWIGGTETGMPSWEQQTHHTMPGFYPPQQPFIYPESPPSVDPKCSEE